MGNLFSSPFQDEFALLSEKKSSNLTLCNKQIAVVPRQIFSFTFLKVINLHNNDINSNQLASVAKSFTVLSNLEELDLSKNKLTTISSDHIAFFPNSLKNLNLHANQINIFVCGDQQLANVVELDLGSNQLENFPESVLQLANLKSLSLCKNKISHLEIEFPESVKLVVLDLSYNQIGKVPSWLAKLPELKSLYLGFNLIEQALLASFTKLTELNEIDLKNNRITSFFSDSEDILKDNLPVLCNLRRLYLNNNSLTLLPKLNFLTALTVVNLSENKLEEFPDFYEHSLRSLMIQNNNIHKISSNQLLNYSKLQEVDLSLNNIVKIPKKLLCKRSAQFAFYSSVPDLIIPNLYLGSEEAAQNKEILAHLQITHIVRVKDSGEISFQDDFKFLVIPILDSSRENIFDHFESAFAFISGAIGNGDNVLVHCARGVSRSATIVISYLMRSLKLSTEGALELAKSKRPIVAPNNGFYKQLKQYDTWAEADTTS